MSVVFILAPFIAISLILLLFAGIKSKENQKEGEKLMRNVFIYLVLFATLMMSIGGSIGIFVALADVVSPAPYHQSFEEYRQWGSEYTDESEEEVKKKTEEELRVGYEAMIENDKEQAYDQSINTLIKSFGWIVIPLPVFIYFQRRLSKSNSNI